MAWHVLREVLHSWSGKVAIALLLIQLALAVYVVVFTDYAKLSRLYLDENAWIGRYPLHVPPCWAVSKHAQEVELVLDTSSAEPFNITIKRLKKYTVYNITWIGELKYEGDAPPSDTLMLLVVNRSGTLRGFKLGLVIERPDGLRIPLLYRVPVPQESVVVIGVDRETPQLLSTVQPESPLYKVIMDSVASVFEAGNATRMKLVEMGLGQILWIGRDFEPVRGVYKIKLSVFFVAKGEADLQHDMHVYFVLRTLGNCYGLMGTDSVGRPIELGILVGLPWSFVISIYVSFLSVMIGGLYGIAAGLARGWKGELLMRIVDVVYSIPILPILIVVIMATKSYSIWLIMTVMIAFLWSMPVVVVRSMTLQIREQPYIETAKAIGVGTLRIIFRYVLPQVMPYLVTLMVLGIPDPILTEAALAFLGLSDPTVPTWGKMLEWAWNEHAVINGWWWSFIFPGLALTVFCATFLLLGRALEPIVAPKIRR
ncbi:binding-protein-dependent transport systems inner membrane component [Pyrolobus fumarii 1A]|uniref:Binding-protein-dependent transport systems inner membrane component n=1 Tax=Pyrolobus fumarii (strain DSM 11204 / 1A) TaxID=694429 RepID=G0EEC0_PYRF1|nr:ABC transporter permease [Pyrolobus fumarii]AEM38814.1 binding-protein-dependent transport systems inner membrane component [Pyrolobus fumarii 1A]